MFANPSSNWVHKRRGPLEAESSLPEDLIS